MFFFLNWYILPVAFTLDLIIGDPQSKIHPIRWMGNAITYFEPRFRKLSTGLISSGLFFAVFLILSVWIITTSVIIIADSIHPFMGNIIQILLIYYAVSACALSNDAMDVGRSLEKNDLESARKKLAFIVGRDVETLDEEGIARAVVETVAENFVDGVVSPLFYAAIGGAPLAMVYKMINTLDSMVGYKNETYEKFGKAAARIDDVANYIPARLSVLVVALATHILLRNGAPVLRTVVKEGSHHTSPNAGYPEAAFAGALGVKLGGPSYYHGNLVEKPYIGNSFGKVNVRHIRKACNLMKLSAILWVTCLWLAVI